MFRRNAVFSSRVFTRGAIALALSLGLLVASGPASAQCADVVINEVLASTTGADTEYVELYGTAGTSLGGLTLIAVESDSLPANTGEFDFRFDFEDCHEIGDDGFFLIGAVDGLDTNYSVTPDVEIPNNSFENNSTTFALVETSSITIDEVTVDLEVCDAIALDDGDLGDEFYFDAPIMIDPGGFSPAGARRVTDGVDTDDISDWELGDFFNGPDNTPTAGEGSTCVVETPTIPEIQGTDLLSTFEGVVVETIGIVTVANDPTDLDLEVFIQDAVGDGDPLTSDGIFVFGNGFTGSPFPDPRPEVGDEILVRGTVAEFAFDGSGDLTITQILPTTVEILSSGNDLPAPVELSDLPDEAIADGIDFWEALEGMHVEIASSQVISPTNFFGGFWMVARADATRLPTAGFFKRSSVTRIVPTVDSVDYNPERIQIDDAFAATANPLLTPGDQVCYVRGVVDYGFSNYRIQAVELETFADELPTTASRRSGETGDLRVTTLNVDGLFDLIDDPNADDVPDAAEQAIKLDKIALAIENEMLLPDIVLLQEVENQTVLQVLADQINASTGTTSYVAASLDTNDDRGIENAFLYNEDVVSLDIFELISDPAFDESREPLVGTFSIGANVVTIVNNHFSSKIGDDPIYGEVQPFTRSTEAERRDQAQVVRDYVNDLILSDPSALVLVGGDLNDYEFEEPGDGADYPLAILAGGVGEEPLENLNLLERAAERFTFIFDGNASSLDHMMATPSLVDFVVGVDILHFNSVFPNTLDDDATTPFRVSAHDAVEVRFDFDL